MSSFAPPLCTDGPPETPVLHRLLRTIGTPMWEYTSELDLLMGFADALRAHQNLYERGILHRDISAGNILMAVDRGAPFRGFLADLEFARIESSSITKPQRTVTTAVEPQNKYNDRGHVVGITEATTRIHINFESTIAVERGAGITGTVQFMAWAILTHTHPDPFTHLVTHDLESFTWVFLYCLWRNVYPRAKSSAPPAEWEEFQILFKAMFGQVSLLMVALARGSNARALNFPQTLPVLTTNCISTALVKVIYGLRSLIHKSQDFDDAIPLTHESLLGVFNDGIASLS